MPLNKVPSFFGSAVSSTTIAEEQQNLPDYAEVDEPVSQIKQLSDKFSTTPYLEWVQTVFNSADDLFDGLIEEVTHVEAEQEEASEYLQQSLDTLLELEEDTEKYYKFYVEFLNLLKTADRFDEVVNVIKSEINSLIKIFEKIYFDERLKYSTEVRFALSKMLSSLTSAAETLDSKLRVIGEELSCFLSIVEKEKKFKDEVSKRLKEHPGLVQWMVDFDNKFQDFFPPAEFNYSVAVPISVCRPY